MTFSLENLLQVMDKEPARQMEEIDRLVESLGFQLVLRPPGSGFQQWRGSYRDARLGKTILHFQAGADRRLSVRLVVDQLERFLPYIQRETWPLRKLIYAYSKCTDCGRCSGGPFLIEDEERIRQVCPVAFLTLSLEQPEQLELVKRLLVAQAELLSADSMAGRQNTRTASL